MAEKAVKFLHELQPKPPIAPAAELEEVAA